MRTGISRRGFLSLAGSGAAFAALARLPAAPALAQAPAAAAPFFSPDESDILASIVERMVDTGLPDAPRVRESGCIATIDRLCGALDPALTQPLPILMRAVDWGPYLFDWRFARFRELDADGKDASLRGWMASSLALRRLAFQALKNLSMLGWYSQDASWASIGYQGPLIARRTVVS
ncbi:MAG TPA: hypothetical protein VNE71_13990 [Myxococcota bacterium]|nr:hypothetical protein [Myxococcota bacterium]